MSASDQPIVMRLDRDGRDVTDLPGLWDDTDVIFRDREKVITDLAIQATVSCSILDGPDKYCSAWLPVCKLACGERVNVGERQYVVEYVRYTKHLGPTFYLRYQPQAESA